jgi:hypothetical protein
MDVAEDMVKQFKRKFLGCNVVFAGDQSVTEKTAEIQESLDKQIIHCLKNGLCFDCGKRIPGEWPPSDKMPEGWSLYMEGDGESRKPQMIVCPECEADTPELGD